VSPAGGARYRFGPRERGGSLAGWRPGQILTVAVGLVIGVLVLRGEPNVAGVAAAVCVLVLYGAMATVPVSGRTGDEWLPVVVCWAARRSRVPGGRAMGALRGVRLLRAGWQDMGVVHDRSGRTLTAAVSLRGRSFALLGPDEQDRRVGAWSSVLASLAREGSPVHRVQWVAASFPDDGRGVHAYLTAEAVADAASASSASYEALLADIDSYACAHDVVLAVQVRLTKSVDVGCATLAREVGSLTRLLADADVHVESVLSAEELAHQLLRTYEPGVPSAARASASASATASGGSAEDPWPMAMEETWSSVRVDGMVHATFWVAEWPRIEVRSDFLAPLLLGSARSTFAVVMEPLGSDAASCRRRAMRVSRRCWRGASRSWQRVTRRSAMRGSSRSRRPTKRTSRRPVTPCSTRPGRAGWRCVGCMATRRRRTPARCRCVEGCAERAHPAPGRDLENRLEKRPRHPVAH